MEWTVLLLPKTSKERGKIAAQAGGREKGLAGRGFWKQVNIVQDGWIKGLELTVTSRLYLPSILLMKLTFSLMCEETR